MNSIDLTSEDNPAPTPLRRKRSRVDEVIVIDDDHDVPATGSSSTKKEDESQRRVLIGGNAGGPAATTGSGGVGQRSRGQVLNTAFGCPVKCSARAFASFPEADPFHESVY